VLLGGHHTIKEKSNKGNIGELIEMGASSVKPKETG
jgi:hypothetical protein